MCLAYFDIDVLDKDSSQFAIRCPRFTMHISHVALEYREHGEVIWGFKSQVQERFEAIERNSKRSSFVEKNDITELVEVDGAFSAFRFDSLEGFAMTSVSKTTDAEKLDNDTSRIVKHIKYAKEKTGWTAALNQLGEHEHSPWVAGIPTKKKNSSVSASACP